MKIIHMRRSKTTLICCMLLVCIFALVVPQTVYATQATINVDITVGQVFTKSDNANAADNFTYTVTALEAGNPMPVGSVGDVYTFSLGGTSDTSIGSITYNHAGVYTYEVKQVITTENPGYTYDKQVHIIKVYVRNTTDGLQAYTVIEVENGVKVSDIAYENKYVAGTASHELMIDPPVKKIVSGSPATDSVFTFKLEAVNLSNPMPAGSADGVKTITITGNGEAEFGTWSYDTSGVYYYKISEVNTGEIGYTYDTAVYTITDRVKDENGLLVLTRTVTNLAGEQVAECTFLNQYTAEQGENVNSDNKGENSEDIVNEDNKVENGEGSANAGDVTTLNSPKTGDDSMIELYQTLIFAGLTTLLGCVIYLLLNKKRKKETEE